jgi:hypothetical protein
LRAVQHPGVLCKNFGLKTNLFSMTFEVAKHYINETINTNLCDRFSIPIFRKFSQSCWHLDAHWRINND